MAPTFKPFGICSWLFKEKHTGVVKTLKQHETPKQCLQLTKSIMEQAHWMTSDPACPMPPKFNASQCIYLAEKLRVVVDKAETFLEVFNSVYESSSFTQEDKDEFLEIFKLLSAYASMCESFIQECCKDAWIQAAVKLANVSDHVSTIGFNLELCAIVFSGSRKWKESESNLSVTELVDKVNEEEVGIVQEKALLDMAALLVKLEAEVQSLLIKLQEQSNTALIEDNKKYQLGSRLLKRLKEVPASYSLGSIPEEVYKEDGNSIMEEEEVYSSSYVTVHKVDWFGTKVVEKKIYGASSSTIKKEATILARMSHHNVATLLCYSESMRYQSIVTKWMDKDLFKLIQERVRFELKKKETRLQGGSDFPFTLLIALDIMLQLAGGMNYVHGLEIGHRDLKSMNILVRHMVKSEYVLVEITDFGESRMDERNKANITLNIGSLRWFPPEVIEPFSTKMSYHEALAKCDVHSFAMVCYEILTGQLPFPEIPNDRPSDIRAKILHGPRPNLLELPDMCPTRLKSLIERCWRLDPSTRPSFGNICEELRYLKYELLMTCAWGKISTLDHYGIEPSWSTIEKISQDYASRIEMKSEIEPSSQMGSYCSLIYLYLCSCRYHSTRIQRLMIKSIPHSMEPHSMELHYSEQLKLGELGKEIMDNRKLFEELKRRNYVLEGDRIIVKQHNEDDEETSFNFFREFDDSLIVGKKIAKGGQAEIYESTAMKGDPLVLKVFNRGLSLQDLERHWPPALLFMFQDDDSRQRSPFSLYIGATLLKDKRLLGRFAFVLRRYWGDLRTLIDIQMIQSKNQGPSFTTNQLLMTMFGIAKDMMSLHSAGIVHRDLKAANILVQGPSLPSLEAGFEVIVADFESSMGVVGAALWRAPEIHQQLMDRNGSIKFTRECNVFSFGMVCYELVSGCIPFRDFSGTKVRDFILEGQRPRLPPNLDPRVESIITSCWEHDPQLRPSFKDIVEDFQRYIC